MYPQQQTSSTWTLYRLLPLYVTVLSVYLHPLLGSSFVFKILFLTLFVLLLSFPTLFNTIPLLLCRKTQVGNNMSHRCFT